MMWAVTFGAVYNLADNYALIEADTYDEALAINLDARAQAGELDGSEFRWAGLFPFDHVTKTAFETQGMTEVPITTPISFR